MSDPIHNAPLALPKTGAPADRALANAGIHTLNDLTRWREADLLAMHGFGPKALRILREALEQAGLRFAG